MEREDVITRVRFFPIKSCQEATIHGAYPVALTVGPTGFEFNGVRDRELVIVDEDNLFVSQRGWDERKARKHAKDAILATVWVDVGIDQLTASTDDSHIKIPIDEPGSSSRLVRIFGPELAARDMGDEPAEFFSDVLGRAVRLVKADRATPRQLGASYQRPDAANQVAGADGRPFSLASQASLDYLHDLVEWPRGTLPLTRFRANIEISGIYLGPFGEDRVREWQIGPMEAYGVKALPRCPIPNIDQRTGEDDKLSTKLLSKTRMGWSLGDDTSERAEPMFAQSLNHVIPEPGTLVGIGDAVVARVVGEPNVVLKESMLR